MQNGTGVIFLATGKDRELPEHTFKQQAGLWCVRRTPETELLTLEKPINMC